MFSLPELQAQLAAFRAKLAEASEHTNRAVELLDEAREVIVNAHEQADAWVPPELAAAVDRLGKDADRLRAADDLVNTYLARL
ncbi:hypothetical protein GCM10017786_34790 [Amycolatopsis deserti]|uniref:Uncharacterized protein n=2 Tax=Amycolatopsis TaxID=1813 RepID=A0ABQ3IYX7_9PSEU|nr:MULTISPECIES: hypothetical protein [Amycolatopsis]OXM62578.1 hypothetical protein CF166_32615 [Amycolatopsis sp. KNN50.9b]UQS22089.1 hypothetical protein L1857_04260 [Amycolatopsis thermalba]GHE98856.1 hypothetical protein GCM10017786_34790 [Amycolatopsis deserti]